MHPHVCSFLLPCLSLLGELGPRMRDPANFPWILSPFFHVFSCSCPVSLNPESGTSVPRPHMMTPFFQIVSSLQGENVPETRDPCALSPPHFSLFPHPFLFHPGELAPRTRDPCTLSPPPFSLRNCPFLCLVGLRYMPASFLPSMSSLPLSTW